jgi:hypothetical protein
MTDAPNIEAEAPKLRKRDRKKGPGAGRPPPGVILTGANMGAFTIEDEPPAKRMGGPSEYTPEIGAKICRELEKGRGPYSIGRDPGMPDHHTISNWLARYPEFYAAYAQARDVGWDVFAEKIVERSVDVPTELAQSRKLEIDAGKWPLSKLAARRYGDRIEVKNEITGPNGGPLQVDALVSMLLTPANMERLSDTQVAAIREAALLLAAPAHTTIEGDCEPVEAPETPAED